MLVTINELTKNIDKVNVDEILSCWQWKISEMKGVVAVSVLGDAFLVGHDQAVYWLQTDSGELLRIADTVDDFHDLIHRPEKIDEWFLPFLVESLIESGKILQPDEVYSCKIPPLFGGEYELDNIIPTDMNIHFGFTGQVFQQIKTLPDGAKVNIRVQKVS
ncbi:MAG: T6SS immunity protein Tdi1 domain-containing protein [Flavitalea sp.]